MTKILLLIIAITFATKSDAQQLQNGSFENWMTMQTEEPNNWASNNHPSPPGTTSSPLVSKSTDAHSGAYAVKMITDTAFNPMIQYLDTTPGFIFTGTIGMPGTPPQLGMPMNQHVDSLTAWFKYTPIANDSFIVIIITTKWLNTHRDTTSRNLFKFGEKSNYTRISLPLNYYAPDLFSDSIYIEFASSNHQGAKIGSTLLIDDVSLVFGTTGIKDIMNEENSFTFYPNPTKNILNITNNVAENIAVLNTIGQTIMNVNTKNKNNLSIDISNLKNGIYILKSETGPVQKLIVTNE
jgi:hypothetical protein